ncbi:formimidoylglutamase [Corynebacterium sp.]|uniref:formimidoylglutamase n=1 Tax=Corynebacterium sp. TaxID=1720 RepID=UPI0026DCF842|nr:formimidoylglutamase [Corynebacterium sp.]MDO5031996.1 formimidoylglutamase [Corynebacterium sp.]
MNTVDAPLYTPAPEWSGRNDGPGPEHARWHSSISSLDINAAAESSPGVALLGFASDEGVLRNGGRQGAAAGPAAIRAALGSLAIHHGQALYDAGTITTQGTDLEGSHAALTKATSALTAAGHLPIILGGGHETAFGSHRGAHATYGPMKVINLDAHFDLRQAEQPTSGTPFTQIAALVGEENFDYSVFGISAPNNTAVLFDEAARLGVDIVLDEELVEMSAAAAAERAVAACDEHSTVHLSIDLDVLPAYQAPGVSAPASLGVAFTHIRAIAVALARTGKLGLVDVVELNPTYDIDGRTAKLAARLIDDITTGHLAATA